MVRRNINFEDETYFFLLNFDALKFSEHIRRAVDDYVVKLKESSSTTSASKNTKWAEGLKNKYEK